MKRLVASNAIDTIVDRRTAIASLTAVVGASVARPAMAHTSRAPVAVAERLRCEWRVDPIGIDAPRPRFRWELTGDTDARNLPSPAIRVLVATTRERLLQRHGDVWIGDGQQVRLNAIRPGNPLPLASHTRYFWTVETTGSDGVARLAPPATFVTGILDPTQWQAAWIAAKPDRPRGAYARGQDKGPPPDPATTVLPLFRRAVTLSAAPVRAIVSIAGLGHFELRVNGRTVTDSVLNPGWTEYSRTILYTSYDVTDLLHAGDNMMGVMLGNGMFNVERRQGRKSKFVDSFGVPKLLLQMTLTHADGRTEQVASDAGWQTADGPILFSSMYGGEDVDARRERVGWDMPGPDPVGWTPVRLAQGPGGRLRAQGVPPVIVQERFTTITVTEPKPGVFIYDLGQNFSGRPEIVVRGPAGATVRFTPAEVLDDVGMAWQRSFNAGPDRLVAYYYTLAGTGEEKFVPRFTYHGFRYIQVEGAVPSGRKPNGRPEVMTIIGQFLFSDLTRVGGFDCDKPLFRRIHALIERAVVSNTFSVITDCPHREKLAWLEQTHLNASTIFYNRDGAALYEKTTDDMVDTQEADGMMPGIAPEYVAFVDGAGRELDARNSPEWGGAIILSPWAAYVAYGDPRCLEAGYPAMRRYAKYLAGRAQGRLLNFGLGDWYDVGPGKLGASQLTNRALTGSATYYQALTTLAKIAQVLGRPAAEAASFADEAQAVQAAFNDRFFDSALGSYDRGSQAANAMPLALGMVPADREADVLAALVAAVRANHNGVTAGDVGFHYVIRALSQYDRDDVIFDMMSVTDRPSYGYQLARGATALTEAWDADPTKSLNHFMLGHGEGWLYGRLAGISTDFSQTEMPAITVAPRPVGDVGAASASLRTVLGEVRAAWRRRGGVLALDVTIPAGAEATIVVPTNRAEAVREGGQSLRDAAGIRSRKTLANSLSLHVGSGAYHFAAPFSGVPA